MGWRGQGAKNKLNKAGEVIKESPEAAKELFKQKATELWGATLKALDKKTKAKILSGTCPGCRRSIKKTTDADTHFRCLQKMQNQIASMKSSHDINLTNHCPTCGTNLLTTYAWNRPDCCKNA